jgi:hypothetical protein
MGPPVASKNPFAPMSERNRPMHISPVPLPAETDNLEPTAILTETGAAFASRHNQANFRFDHRLSESALFTLPSLGGLASRRPDHPAFAYWSNGAVGPSARWEVGSRRLPLAETIASIAENDSLVMLKRVEQDPIFRPLMLAVLSQVVAACGTTLKDDALIGRATILLASPGRVTAYHMDSDCNYLFQVRGDKLIRVFDQVDRQPDSETTLERFFGGDINSARLEDAPPATAYRLDAGIGVHIPCLSPHWAEVGRDVSVAVSINFDLRSASRIGHIYRVNDQLRRRGLVPVPPGRSKWRDGLKVALAEGAIAAKRLIRPTADPFPESGWRPS